MKTPFLEEKFHLVFHGLFWCLDVPMVAVASWTALYGHAKCVLTHFSDAADVRGADPALTGKAHGPMKRI